jgi:hypothetical protein
LNHPLKVEGAGVMAQRHPGLAPDGLGHVRIVLELAQHFTGEAQGSGTFIRHGHLLSSIKASFRPEILGAAAEEIRFDFMLDPKDIPEKFETAVLNQIASSEREILRVINSLTPLQTAVLRVLSARLSDFAPFQEETMTAYKAVLHDIAPQEKVEPDGSNVQQALMALQTKALIWKEARGVYAIEESSTIDLMRAQGMLDTVPTPSTRRTEREI